MNKVRPALNPRNRPLSSGLAVSFFAAIACFATIVVVASSGISKIPSERISNDNPFIGYVNAGIGFIQVVEFTIGGTVTGTLALVGFFLSIAGAKKGETRGNLTGVLLCLASVVFLVLYLLLCMLF